MNDERNENAGSGGHHEPGPIPVDPPEPRAKISKESLMSLGADTCPTCGAELPNAKATVCLECGYDMKANKKVRTKVGVEEVDDEGDAAFCRAGRVPWKALLGLGTVLIVLAVGMAWGDPPENTRPFFYALKTLVYAVVHLGLGIGAVIATAMLLREKVGQIEYGVGWMSIAIGAFFVSIQLGQLLGAGLTAQWIVGATLGAALYLGVVWTAFRTSRDVVLMVAGLQFMFWLLLWIYTWVQDLSIATGAAG
jgi:hypothetical protein